MARRPVFIPLGQWPQFVGEVQFAFDWSPGFSVVQKRKNIAALHRAAERGGLFPLLEVSTKSEEKLGQRLSAFSLCLDTTIGPISLESAYQGSKVFEGGGPFTDIYEKNSWEAKKDPRVRQSGRLVRFEYFGEEWPIFPQTAFYNWLYLTALKPHQDYLKRLFIYSGFTDIEFNPDKSINCQAKACALLVSMLRMGLLDQALRSQRDFMDIVSAESAGKILPATFGQGQLTL